jgi:methionine aminotransferase
LLGYRRITDEADDAFAVRMTGDYGVAAIPISVFYRDKTDRKVLRFCFAKSDETLERAAEKLHAV